MLEVEFGLLAREQSPAGTGWGEMGTLWVSGRGQLSDLGRARVTSALTSQVYVWSQPVFRLQVLLQADQGVYPDVVVKA